MQELVERYECSGFFETIEIDATSKLESARALGSHAPY